MPTDRERLEQSLDDAEHGGYQDTARRLRAEIAALVESGRRPSAAVVAANRPDNGPALPMPTRR